MLTKYSLRSMRLEVVGTRKNGRARRRHPSRVSLARARSLFHYFEVPATQARPSMIMISKLFSVFSPIGVLRRNILCLVHFATVMFPVVSPTCQIQNKLQCYSDREIFIYVHAH